MQMALSDYHSITLNQFFNKAEGFFKHQASMQEAEWMRSNYIVFSLISMHPYIDKHQKPKSFEQFLNSQQTANEKAKKAIEKL